MALEAQKLSEDELKNRADELIGNFGLEKVAQSPAWLTVMSRHDTQRGGNSMSRSS